MWIVKKSSFLCQRKTCNFDVSCRVDFDVKKLVRTSTSYDDVIKESSFHLFNHFILVGDQDFFQDSNNLVKHQPKIDSGECEFEEKRPKSWRKSGLETNQEFQHFSGTYLEKQTSIIGYKNLFQFQPRWTKERCLKQTVDNEFIMIKE